MRKWIILVLVVFALPSPTQSRQGSQSNEVSYAGQQVAAVDLVANPKISLNFVRPLVQQHAGEPYSDSKVANTISALRVTGRFNNIAVEVNPGVEGLHVTFKLEPALYFGILDFPGTGKAFSYTKLLQVIDIPNDTPYKQDVVSKSAENLRQFFVSSGFFQAEVQPEPQFD